MSSDQTIGDGGFTGKKMWINDQGDMMTYYIVKTCFPVVWEAQQSGYLPTILSVGYNGDIAIIWESMGNI